MFYPLKIKNIQRETSDCVSLALDIPPQYQEDFKFYQGQYLTFKTVLNGEELRRSYSICSAPNDKSLRVAVKKVPNGQFSTYANEVLKEGDVLEVMPPMGHFYTPLSKEHEKTYIFWAAGSGITPIISNIKAILSTEPKSQCTLIYGNRKVSSIIFKEELEALKNQYLGRFQVFNILSREYSDSDLLQGRLDKAKIQAFTAKIPFLLRGDEYFACGPIEMVEALKEVLIAAEIEDNKIHTELFNAPKQNFSSADIKNAVESEAQIELDGRVFSVPIEKGQNILDAAQAIGSDLPFACKGGVCCTCRAKLLEGEVEMMANYALTKEEVHQGFILTCQAIPKTDRVVVSFDIK